MQNAVLPIDICNKIDQRIRNFVWGSLPDGRKPHLVSWDDVCRPKNQGGLGLRRAKELNDAYLIKLGWTLVSQPSVFWVRLLRAKYLKNGQLEVGTFRNCPSSALWRGIRRVWDHVHKGIQVSVSSGRSTRFWHDSWLDGGICLADTLSASDYTTYDHWTVRDAVTATGGWNWDVLNPILPAFARRMVAGMNPPSEEGEDDFMWGLEPNGRFTLKSAYNLLASIDGNTSHRLWRVIWKWRGPYRVTHFLWLAAKQRLMTNEERCRRHIATSAQCVLCNRGTESHLHTLRDCPIAKATWYDILGTRIWPSFFDDDLQVWIVKGAGHTSLSLEFGLIAWLLWKHRNEVIFSNLVVTCDQLRLRVLYWIAGVRETMRVGATLSTGNKPLRREALVGWQAPPEDYVTVNTDGSVLQPGSRAAGGGVIHDSQGRVLKAFAANFGSCSITRAELRGAIHGLSLAWDLGYRKVYFQMDSSCALAFLLGDPPDDARHGSCIREARQLLNRDWEVITSHIYREGNTVADLLAHHGHSLSFGFHVLPFVPSNILASVQADMAGILFPRFIPLNN
ncbi:Putative ribonuclease H protein At1g65750 [Linum grandiflorum]